MIKPLSRCSAGLDVHQRLIVVTVLTLRAEGEVVKEVRQFGTVYQSLTELALWLKSVDPEVAVMESTGVYWQQVYEHLEEVGVPIYVVNARHVKNVPGRKTDVADSEWLAELALCGLLRFSFIPPKDFRQLRFLTRYDLKLSGIVASEKNRLHKALEGCGIKLSSVVSDIDGVSARLMIEAIIAGQEPSSVAALAQRRLKAKTSELVAALATPLSDRQRLTLKVLQAHLRWLEGQQAQIQQQVVAAMTPYQNAFQLAQTLPGIETISAARLLAEIGVDMTRFKNQDHLTSWAGFCPSNQESAGKRKSGRCRKGNRYVKQILCEAANAAVKTNSQFKSFYQGLVIRRGHKRAIVAVARKLLEVLYVVLKKQTPYQDPDIDYQALVVKRNAPRWIKALDTYGYLERFKTTT